MMIDVSPTATTIIARHVPPALRHKIAPEADLRADLGLHDIDLWDIAIGIEEARGGMFDGEPEAAWQTVGDVIAAEKELNNA